MHCYQHDARRLLVLGYNATLTVATEAPRGSIPKRTFDQMQARCLLRVESSAMFPQIANDRVCTHRAHMHGLEHCCPRQHTVAPAQASRTVIYGHEPLLTHGSCRGSTSLD